MKSLFIVFEGIDGSGTSTQVEMLKNFFLNNSRKAVTTSEPSNGPIGNLIKEAMKKRILFSIDPQIFDHQMAYLFAADRFDHLYNDVDGIINLFKNNITVISTRYFFSSFAYHCDNEKDLFFVNTLNSKFPNPDLLVYIDNPIEISLKRIGKRATPDIYENSEKLKRVKKNYESIMQNYKGDLLVVEGASTIEDIHSQIVKYILDNYND